MSTNDERLANETLALADEIEADAKREIARLDALIAAATDADDFDAIGFFLVEQFCEERRLQNAAVMRAAASEFKSQSGVKH